MHGSGKVTGDAIRLSVPTGRSIEFKLGDGEGSARISMRVDEVRTIVEFLRSKGIEVDPLREKQRKVAYALAQSFELPRSSTAEAAD